MGLYQRERKLDCCIVWLPPYGQYSQWHMIQVNILQIHPYIQLIRYNTYGFHVLVALMQKSNINSNKKGDNTAFWPSNKCLLSLHFDHLDLIQRKVRSLQSLSLAVRALNVFSFYCGRSQYTEYIFLFQMLCMHPCELQL